MRPMSNYDCAGDASLSPKEQLEDELCSTFWYRVNLNCFRRFRSSICLHCSTIYIYIYVLLCITLPRPFRLVLSCARVYNCTAKHLAMRNLDANVTQGLRVVFHFIKKSFLFHFLQDVDVAVVQYFFSTGQWAAPSCTGVCCWYSEVVQIVGWEIIGALKFSYRAHAMIVLWHGCDYLIPLCWKGSLGVFKQVESTIWISLLFPQFSARRRSCLLSLYLQGQAGWRLQSVKALRGTGCTKCSHSFETISLQQSIWIAECTLAC